MQKKWREITVYYGMTRVGDIDIAITLNNVKFFH